MVTVSNIEIETYNYLHPFYNIETEKLSDFIVLATDVYTMVTSRKTDENLLFPNIPTTFGLHYDTPILLDNGEKYSIGRWYEERRISRIGLLLYDNSIKKFIPGLSSIVGLGEYLETYTITLSTGSRIKCSKDLPFLLDNNTSVKAKDLVIGQMLKSFFNYDALTKTYSLANKIINK